MSNETQNAAASFLELLKEAAKPKDTQTTTQVGIEYAGKKITLPNDPSKMSPGEAVKHLQRLEAAEQQEVGVNIMIDANPYDGAVALDRAVKQMFGWSDAQMDWTFFGPRPPQKLSIAVDLHTRIEVIWGKFNLPGIEGTLSCGVGHNQRGVTVFAIQGSVKQKHYEHIKALGELTEKFAREQSIYRGKALTLVGDDDGTIADCPPEFLALDKKDPLILPHAVERAIEANIMTIVEKSDVCRKAGIPLKRGVILAGKPGTGKTLTAQELAIRATKAGWTYILVANAHAVANVIEFAQRYAPAVVFCEDIDSTTSGERNLDMNALLNTVDGINTKNKEIMLVFTSNNISQMERTLVRPGRIDAIIEFPVPDKPTIEKFLRHYGNGLVLADQTLEKSCDALYGAIPAIIREAVERAKLYAIARGVPLDAMQLTDDDIYVAVETLKAHTDFFNEKREKIVSPEEALGIALKKVVVGDGPTNAELHSSFKAICEHCGVKLS